MNNKFKRAQSEYISWVILLGLVVVISFFLYNWSISQAQKTSDQLEQSTDPLICADAGFSIDGSCQDFRSINLNITNIRSREIKGFLIKTVGLYPEEDSYISTTKLYFKIPPGDFEEVRFLKKGTISQIELIPIVAKNKKDIYCEEQSVKKEKSSLKYC